MSGVPSPREGLNEKDDISDDDYYMPPEWYPHAACIILYPHNPATFRLEQAQEQVLQVARAIAGPGQEAVLLLCPSQPVADQVQQKLQNDETTSSSFPIITAVCPSNDTWSRDTAPTFLIPKSSSTTRRRRQLVGLDWDFNAYGGPEHGCYWPCTLDVQIAAKVCDEILPQVWNQLAKTTAPLIRRQHVPIVLEGGSIHTDGQGTLLTTSECLANPNRNPSKTLQQLETILCQSINCRQILWLPLGLAYDDDTNGHVDNMACFVRPGHVVLAWTDDEIHNAENYQRCRKAYHVLTTAANLTIHKLYLPSPPLVYSRQEAEDLNQAADDNDTTNSCRQAGQPLAASYVNFYIANQAVVVPQFGNTEYDQKALDTLRPIFPQRQVVGVATREILVGGGNIHCITQQVPLV